MRKQHVPTGADDYPLKQSWSYEELGLISSFGRKPISSFPPVLELDLGASARNRTRSEEAHTRSWLIAVELGSRTNGAASDGSGDAVEELLPDEEQPI
jgi:hypothetical protein